MKISARLGFASASALGLLLALPGCDLVLGLNNYQDCTSNCGGANATGSTSASTASGTGGAAPQCTAANAVANCDDMNPCTDDTCVMGTCQHVPSAELTACGPMMAGSCDGKGACLTGKGLWAKNWGTVGSAQHEGTSITTDGNGNVLVAGVTGGPISFGGTTLTPTQTQPFMLKLDPSGTPLKATLIDAGGTMASGSTGIAADTMGNVFVASSLGPGGKNLVKLDPGGVPLWGKSFSVTNPVDVSCAAIDQAGNVLVTATISGTANFGSGNLQSVAGPLVVAKFGSNGTLAWVKQFMSGQNVAARSAGCAVDKDGALVAVGATNGSVDFGGGTVPYPGTAISAMYLVKLDGAGGHAWSHIFGSTGTALARSVATDSSKNVVFTGGFLGKFSPSATVDLDNATSNTEVFLIKFAPTGQYLWHRIYGDGSADALGVAVAIGPADDIVMAAAHKGSLDLGGGVMTMPGAGMLKLDPAGKRLWSNAYGGLALALDPAGRVFATAAMSGQVDFGSAVLTAIGDTDVYVAAFAP